MSNLFTTTLRFNLNREEDRRALEYLRNADEYSSYSRAVISAVNDHFSRRERMKDDPYLETREKEDAFLRRVQETIEKSLSDEERVADAVAYMKDKYGTNMFDEADEVATVGDLRTAMIDLYGLERDYVYGINTEMPQESDEYFMPWGWDDGQTVDRDIAVYAAVKAHDPSIVADWSSIKDDNGYYPGVRVAVVFSEETGITTGANRPGDITLGELALILANTDRVFDAAAEK